MAACYRERCVVQKRWLDCDEDHCGCCQEVCSDTEKGFNGQREDDYTTGEGKL